MIDEMVWAGVVIAAVVGAIILVGWGTYRSEFDNVVQWLRQPTGGRLNWNAARASVMRDGYLRLERRAPDAYVLVFHSGSRWSEIETCDTEDKGMIAAKTVRWRIDAWLDHSAPETVWSEK